MPELVSWLPGAISAAVSVGGAIASAVLWFRARDERREAARQAGLANDAAIASESHLARIADAQTEQHQAITTHTAVKERDPWQLQRLPDTNTEAHLYNDSSTAKYQVRVVIAVYDGGELMETWKDTVIPFVGPNRPTRIPFLAMSATMAANITWHLHEDCSDEAQSQIITW